MFGRLASSLASLFAAQGIFNAEDAAVYAYGFELIISSAFNVLVIVVISIIFMQPFSWLFFLLAFIPLRLTAGGYHAKSHLGCCVVFGTSYAILLLSAIVLIGKVSPTVLILISVLNLLAVFILSPIPSSNKPLNAEQTCLNRRSSLFFAAAAVLMTLTSILVGPNYLIHYIVFVAGQVGASLSLIAAKFEKKDI